jgi:hypothetical protein
VRILYFSRNYGPHDRRFLTAVRGMGHEVAFLSLEGGGRVPDGDLPDGVQYVEWRSGGGSVGGINLFRVRTPVRKVLSRLQPDLIHAGPVQTCGFLMALNQAKPLVTMSWGSDILVGASGGAGRMVARWTLARSTILLCDCQAVRVSAQGLGVESDRIVVFPWGVDLQHFSPGSDGGLRGRLGWQDSIVLLSTRSMEAAYGLDTLVEGFIRAARADPRLRLCMLSDGSLRAELTERLGKARMLNRVHWSGQVPLARLPEYYRAADWYLSASLSDGSSVSLLEAMACGLPAIVSDIPGNREWVEAGVNGILFPSGNPEALSNQLGKAAAMGEQRSQWGERSRDIAEAKADWNVHVGRLQAAYDRAIHLSRVRG